ncbi:hypothetical protein V2J09_012939 [Rumex salicifolius]
MASLVLIALFLGLTGYSSAYCICKDGLSENYLQKNIDYACGAGADCTPILQNGGCYQPNTVKSHCDYAVNNYYQKKGQITGSCDFSGTAVVTSTLPTTLGSTCTYPASPSQVNSPTTTTGTGTGTASQYTSMGPSSMDPAGSSSHRPSQHASFLFGYQNGVKQDLIFNGLIRVKLGALQGNVHLGVGDVDGGAKGWNPSGVDGGGLAAAVQAGSNEVAGLTATDGGGDGEANRQGIGRGRGRRSV